MVTLSAVEYAAKPSSGCCGGDAEAAAAADDASSTFLSESDGNRLWLVATVWPEAFALAVSILLPAWAADDDVLVVSDGGFLDTATPSLGPGTRTRPSKVTSPPPGPIAWSSPSSSMWWESGTSSPPGRCKSGTRLSQKDSRCAR
jgi:hypothetical protein